MYLELSFAALTTWGNGEMGKWGNGEEGLLGPGFLLRRWCNVLLGFEFVIDELFRECHTWDHTTMQPCTHSSLHSYTRLPISPLPQHPIAPVWNMQNDWRRIPYYQQFVEFPIHAIVFFFNLWYLTFLQVAACKKRTGKKDQIPKGGSLPQGGLDKTMI
jgi:hypothetical protein